MKKNLIISTVGDNSHHKEWIAGEKHFDVILIYYGNNPLVFENYQNDGLTVIQRRGQKYPLLNNFIDENKCLIDKYEYIWLPDDDISIDTVSINKMFSIALEYALSICQPSLSVGDYKPSWDITVKTDDTFLRYTNFIEVMMPLFKKEVLFFLYDDFSLSNSGWGLDMTWSHRIGHPTDKIAILDSISAIHTRPTGSDYARFTKHPKEDLILLTAKYGLPPIISPTNYRIVRRPSKNAIRKHLVKRAKFAHLFSLS